MCIRDRIGRVLNDDNTLNGIYTIVVCSKSDKTHSVIDSLPEKLEVTEWGKPAERRKKRRSKSSVSVHTFDGLVCSLGCSISYER